MPQYRAVNPPPPHLAGHPLAYQATAVLEVRFLRFIRTRPYPQKLEVWQETAIRAYAEVRATWATRAEWASIIALAGISMAEVTYYDRVISHYGY